MDAEVPVHGQHHQGHEGRPHDGGHEALDCAAGEGPRPVVSWPLVAAPMYGHQHRCAQAGHQGQQGVAQRQVSDEQQRQAPGGGLQHEAVWKYFYKK